MKYWKNGFHLGQDENNSRVEITDEYWKELLDGNSKGKVIRSDENGYPVLTDYVETEEEKVYKRKYYIIERLESLTKDFIQNQCGAVFEDLEERKKEFRALHNELRILEGKEKRNYMEEDADETN